MNLFSFVFLRDPSKRRTKTQDDRTEDCGIGLKIEVGWSVRQKAGCSVRYVDWLFQTSLVQLFSCACIDIIEVLF